MKIHPDSNITVQQDSTAVKENILFSDPVLQKETGNNNPFSDPLLTKGQSSELQAMKTDSTVVVNTDSIKQKEEKDSSVQPRAVTESVESVTVKPPLAKDGEYFGYSGWFIGVIITALVLTAAMKLTYSKLFSDVMSGFFRRKFILKVFDNKTRRDNSGFTMMNLLFLITVPLFIFEYIVKEVDSGMSDFQSYIYILSAFSGFCVFKLGIARFLGAVFKSSREAKEYNFNLLIHFKMLGVFLLPLILSIPYVYSGAVFPLLIIGAGLIILQYLLIVLRGLKILFKKHVSILYMILYLCALEIVPVALVLKFIEVI